MGNVAVLFRLYTEEGKEEEVRKEVIAKLSPKGTELEDVAFGIKVVKVLFIHDDKVGSSDIEEKLKKITNVKEVEVIEETLI